MTQLLGQRPREEDDSVTRTLYLDGESLTLDDVAALATAAAGTWRVILTNTAAGRVQRAQQAVEACIARGDVVYGITTGFGAFKDRIISSNQVAQLQRNIVRSHAAGVGRPLDAPTTRALMLVRANALAKGYSGVRLETLQLLLETLNRDVLPVIPSQGSLGASGDLAPLAHMALVLIGEGEAVVRGEWLPGASALERVGLRPVTLGAKEGLALTNGTALMCAQGCLVTRHAEGLAQAADVAGCLSLEALHGTPAAFDARVHAVRPHPRQVECAAYLRNLLEGSTFVREHDPLNVQDAYTLRCIPQVHGAVRDAIAYARWVLEIEINSATDNPLIFLDEETGDASILSGGNFHGQPVALAMDYLGMALAGLGNMSERRLTRLTDEASNAGTLPAFLIKHGGLHSGFMLVQYTAAALASENKVLAHPATADTIPTSANTEDHVSMGPIAARHTQQIADNVERILAIELLAAAQGIDFRREAMPGARLGRGTVPAYQLVRQRVPFLERDAVMSPYMEAVRELVASGELIRAVDRVIYDDTPRRKP